MRPIVAPVPWIFGYGSLAGPGGSSTSLRGYRRTWGVAMDNTVDLPSYKHYVDAETGERPGVCVAFLDIEECAPGSEVNGAVLWVDDGQLPAFDARERNYRRIEVTGRLDPDPGGIAWTYVGLDASRARARESPCVISRDYLDGVRAGFAALGTDELATFELTTPTPSGPVRALRRVNHAPLTEGEQWAREQLAALRERRFTPRALAAFLLASQRRANEVRRAQPELGGQSRRWMALGAAAWAAGALAGAEPFRRRASTTTAWWGACTLMLDWHLGMVETSDGRPRPLGAADAMTLARAWLVPLAADDPAPLVCALAAASDVLDGRLARRAEPTRIGRDLEGLVDFCFAVAALRGARRHDLVGRSVVAAELTRLSAGFAYALGVYFGRAEPPDPGLLRAARLTTPVRAAGLIAAGLRRRRLADALLAAGALVSLGATSRAWRSG